VFAPVEITYSLDREDFWGFQRYTLLNVQPFKRNMIVNMVIQYLVFAVIGILLRAGTGEVIGLTLIGGSAGVAELWWSSRRNSIRLLDGKPGLLGEHTIRISEEGVRERTAVSDGLITWAGIRRVVEGTTHIYLFIEAHMAFVIPKRAFRDEDEAKRFLEEASSLWRTYAASTS
jgi:hypothetical protein